MIDISDLLNLSPDIRYVAVLQGGDLRSGTKNAADSSSSETDRYEELLVNPTLLFLAGQRGNIDCGGVEYLVVRYGNFFQFMQRISDGHVSVCIAKNADLLTVVDSVRAYLLGHVKD